MVQNADDDQEDGCDYTLSDESIEDSGSENDEGHEAK